MRVRRWHEVDAVSGALTYETRREADLDRCEPREEYSSAMPISAASDECAFPRSCSAVDLQLYVSMVRRQCDGLLRVARALPLRGAHRLQGDERFDRYLRHHPSMRCRMPKLLKLKAHRKFESAILPSLSDGRTRRSLAPPALKLPLSRGCLRFPADTINTAFMTQMLSDPISMGDGTRVDAALDAHTMIRKQGLAVLSHPSLLFDANSSTPLFSMSRTICMICIGRW
jgi:hypothetical protein